MTHPAAQNTEIIYIGDKSGSMDTIRDDALGGYNAFLKDQQKAPGRARLTHVQFDDKLHPPLYRGVDIDTVKPLTRSQFIPTGGTALYDAICETLIFERARIEAQEWADHVIVCIQTDGEENVSRHYNGDDVKKSIAAAEKRGWVFVYLGANQDAFAVARSMGMTKGTSMNFTADAQGTQSGYARMSDYVGTTRSLSKSVFFDAKG